MILSLFELAISMPAHGWRYFVLFCDIFWSSFWVLVLIISFARLISLNQSALGRSFGCGLKLESPCIALFGYFAFMLYLPCAAPFHRCR
ncbi:hypothetical protein BKN38_06235 [Helicobacter sp. CLO-3]|nr:hypothetical protein BA723_06265 [Helicobacter sp. CLO-3]OHU82950.1 hypothetical protein BKN38_06235 [Helicobacter sp. CLO-3]